MVTAWLISASIGVMLPRYMKKTWVGKQLMGKDMWFALHRGLMVSVIEQVCSRASKILLLLRFKNKKTRPYTTLSIAT